MHNIVKTVFLFTSLLLIMACNSNTEDKLDGKWQIQQIESNGNVQKLDTIFYNFQTSLFQYQVYDKATDTYPVSYGFRTLKEDNQLLLEINNPSFLYRTDWAAKERTFTIEKLAGSKLILSSEGKQYTFRKF